MDEFQYNLKVGKVFLIKIQNSEAINEKIDEFEKCLPGEKTSKAKYKHKY